MHAEQNVTHHYYDPCARPTDAVRDKKEYAVVNSMAKIGLLTFGEPCVQGVNAYLFVLGFFRILFWGYLGSIFFFGIFWGFFYCFFFVRF